MGLKPLPQFGLIQNSVTIEWIVYGLFKAVPKLIKLIECKASHSVDPDDSEKRLQVNDINTRSDLKPLKLKTKTTFK